MTLDDLDISGRSMEADFGYKQAKIVHDPICELVMSVAGANGSVGSLYLICDNLPVTLVAGPDRRVPIGVTV
jgi:hypothetical protein